MKRSVTHAQSRHRFGRQGERQRENLKIKGDKRTKKMREKKKKLKKEIKGENELNRVRQRKLENK